FLAADSRPHPKSVSSKSVFGARLCPQGQPQRVTNSETFAFYDLLRLVFDTAALQAHFENMPQSSHRVSAAARRAAAAGPVRVEEFATRFVHAFVSVRAEIIALRMQQVRRQNCGTILIVERERGAE